ncbi:uncharacterized protein LOC127240650 [Andrographis paniculata]|uniref:uncharacterized protein LOC127240650 n=1 Tax=Andrographis paniculata TaxID=175694 RepID=UPI0021E7150B|nr:uncharacterized protein LOC127240650 [Andrographis paniculata]
MEFTGGKGEKKASSGSSVLKKLERYLSIKGPKRTRTRSVFTKSKSWPGHHQQQHQVAPSGCFCVYVGPEKQRFVIKTELANHPLFRMLLEDAELEYGFTSDGPLLLPCDVDLFYRVLAEMDHDGKEREILGGGYGFGSGGCSPFTPGRRHSRVGGGGCGSYGLLTPPRMLKINQF